MKIRQGFVSNSSTSSFCLFGVCLEGRPSTAIRELIKEDIDINSREELITYIKKNKLEDDVREITEENWEEYRDEILDEDDDVDKILDKLLKDTVLSYVSDYEGEGLYIGRSYGDIDDNETGKEFKESVVRDLKKLGIKDKPGHQEGTISC